MSVSDRVQTSLWLDRRDWLALRRLAELRAVEEGGKPSAAAVVAELIREESRRLERER